MTDASGCSGTRLAAKLGVDGGSRLLLAAAPPAWRLEGAPPTATIELRATATPYDVILLFCLDHSVLARRFAPLAGHLTTGGALWAAWPKKSSGVATDLTESAVREFGLDAGLVDVKICAVDATWSALKFVRRLRDR